MIMQAYWASITFAGFRLDGPHEKIILLDLPAGN